RRRRRQDRRQIRARLQERIRRLHRGARRARTYDLPEAGQRRDCGERRREAVPERAGRVQGHRARVMALLIGNVLRHAARSTPRRLAATLQDEELTFGALDERANRTARVLAGMGVGHGDRVAWWGNTSLDALPIFFALARLGAVFAPVNARLGPDEAAAVVGCARPRLLLGDAAHADRVQESAAPTAPPAHLFGGATRASAADVDAPALTERDPHVIFFTSGSTGRPKGVVLSHRAGALRSFPPLAADSDGGTVCMFPLFHMAGWSLGLGCWQSRRPIHFVRVPDAETLLQTVERRRATRIYLIPAVWARVLDHGVKQHDVSS